MNGFETAEKREICRLRSSSTLHNPLVVHVKFYNTSRAALPAAFFSVIKPPAVNAIHKRAIVIHQMETCLVSKTHEKSHLRVTDILLRVTDFLHTTVLVFTLCPCDMQKKIIMCTFVSLRRVKRASETRSYR